MSDTYSFCSEAQRDFGCLQYVNGKGIMDELHALQDEMPNIKELLLKFTHEQLSNLFFENARAKVCAPEKGFLAQDFEKVCPKSYCYYDIYGKPQHERHPLVKYMCTLVDDKLLTKKTADKITKQYWAEHIERALLGFANILDEDPFNHEDRDDDEEFVTLTIFEAYLRKCAVNMYRAFKDLKEANDFKKAEVENKRRELRNLKQNVKNAEKRVKNVLEHLENLKREQLMTEVQLSQIVD